MVILVPAFSIEFSKRQRILWKWYMFVDFPLKILCWTEGFIGNMHRWLWRENLSTAEIGGLFSASFWLPSGCFVRNLGSACRTWRQFQGRWWTYDEHTLTLCALLMYIYFPVLQLYYSSLLSVLYSYNWFPACLMCPWWTQPMEWKSDLRINNNNC